MMLLIPGVACMVMAPSHPGVNTGNSFGKRRCSLRGILVHIQGPDYSRAEQRSFGNQKCRRLPAFEQEQTVLKYEQPHSWGRSNVSGLWTCVKLSLVTR